MGHCFSKHKKQPQRNLEQRNSINLEEKDEGLDMLQALVDMEKKTDESFERKLEAARNNMRRTDPNEVKIFVEGDL